MSSWIPAPGSIWREVATERTYKVTFTSTNDTKAQAGQLMVVFQFVNRYDSWPEHEDFRSCELTEFRKRFEPFPWKFPSTGAIAPCQ